MTDDSVKVRIDKWLWAARFFKTRALATAAIEGGKVEINGVRPKPSRAVRVGETLKIRRADELFEVQVLALSEQRGSASVAQTLYAETEHSQQQRQQARELRRLQAGSPAPERRPDKQQRRQIIRFVRQGS